MTQKIEGPAIQCKNCKLVIKSTSKYDWKCCLCFNGSKENLGIYIDGGGERTIVGGNLPNIIWLAEDSELIEE